MIIYYKIALLVLGLVCCIHAAIWRRTWCVTNHIKAPRQASWADFGLFIWLVSFVIFVGVPFLSEALYALGPDTFWTFERKNIIGAFISQSFLLVFLLISYCKQTHFWDGALNISALDWARWMRTAVYIFLASIPLLFLVNWLWQLILSFADFLGWTPSQELQPMVEILKDLDSLPLQVLIALTVTCIAPITEEWVFRMGIYRFLKSKMPAFSAAFVSAFLFACIHNNMASFLPLLFLGLLLTRAYEVSGNIAVPMIFHGCFNMNTLIILFLDRGF